MGLKCQDVVRRNYGSPFPVCASDFKRLAGGPNPALPRWRGPHAVQLHLLQGSNTPNRLHFLASITQANPRH